MFQPTIISWILIIFGLITCLPLLFAQLIVLLQPHGQKAKDILIGKDEEWRDITHFKSAYGAAWADWLIFVPLFMTGIIGMLLNKQWGIFLFSMSAVIQVYINTLLWFLEKEFVYPSKGPLKYYTYYWGNFMYWGTASIIYGFIRLNGII
jgi:hypothetical protein